MEHHYYPSACYQSRMCTGTTTGATVLVNELVEKPRGIEQLITSSSATYEAYYSQRSFVPRSPTGTKIYCGRFHRSKSRRRVSYTFMGWLLHVLALAKPLRFKANQNMG